MEKYSYRKFRFIMSIDIFYATLVILREPLWTSTILVTLQKCKVTNMACGRSNNL